MKDAPAGTMRRRAACACIALLAASTVPDAASAAPAPAGDAGTACGPAIALLRSIYRRIEADPGYSPVALLRAQGSRPLLRALDADEANTPDGDVGALDFDVFTNAQDASIRDTRIRATASPDVARCGLQAAFLNYDQPIRLDFSMVREDDGAWKIDDIAIPDASGDPSWRLRGLLEAPADDAPPPPRSDARLSPR